MRFIEHTSGSFLNVEAIVRLYVEREAIDRFFVRARTMDGESVALSGPLPTLAAADAYLKSLVDQLLTRPE